MSDLNMALPRLLDLAMNFALTSTLIEPHKVAAPETFGASIGLSERLLPLDVQN
jgi:hypothetical protein